jgi:hypothetical protein
LLLYLQARSELGEDVRFVGRAREYRQPTVPHGDDSLFCLVWCVATARTLESTRWMVMQEVWGIVGCKPTERTELFEMVLTPDERNRELVQKQERESLSVR